ncbi:extracellular mutant protein 11-domain-containing protein [Coniochaeta sp. 2T2.1]|nr:extracellular mutant protein 11-domain-containing protein [Coniochaeta sp. 2T2.1]
MRSEMMPTARKKMSSMGMFMSRHADGTASGPTTPKQGMATTAPAQSPPQTTLQPAPHIVVSRQEIAASAKIPVPRNGRFGYTGAAQGQHQQVMSPPRQQSLPGSPPAAASHYHPMQRSNTDQPNGRPNGALWEDSTVASMFEETDSRGGSDRNKGQHNRAFSETTYRPMVARHERQRSDDDDNRAFVIGDDGLLQVVGQSGAAVNGPSATTLNTSVQSGINEQPAQADEVTYRDNDQYHTPPRNLRRTKLAQRDPREPKRDSFHDDQLADISSPPDNHSARGSPGRRNERTGRLDGKLEEAARERDLREYDRSRERERELNHKRSTFFADLTPVTEGPTWHTQAAVGVPSVGDAATSDDFKEALQRTPRGPPSVRPLVSRPASRPPQLTRKPSIRDGSLTRSASHRLQKLKKRQRSPDYNDAELNEMSYAELQKQDFDYDPQAAAMQQTSVPSGNSLQDKLTYYKDKDSLDQHQFFTQISIGDWDEAGDWFLDQFSGVVQKLKASRKQKREMVAQFEKEITEREEAVRNKMEGIGRTLQELKQEGQNMMSGKDVDV